MFSISKRPTIKEIQDLYRSQKAVPSQVFQFFLNRSKVIDKKLNTVQNYTTSIGTQEAEFCDMLLKELFAHHHQAVGSDQGNTNDQRFEDLIQEYPLFGIPYSLKAIIQAEGEVFTASSQLLKGFHSTYSSTVYKKVKAAGAILIAINHMDEFAMGSSGENSSYGPTANPYDLSRVPGGSSSGPVAAVASGQVVFSLGTDTGGSIRQPAAFCGVVGLKPTYGAVSRYGVIPMASSFDQVGPITQNIRDNQIVFSVIAGQDPKDQTSIDSSETLTAISQQLRTKESRETKSIKATKKKLKIGIPKEFYVDGLDPQIREAMLLLEARLSEIGHELVQISLPLIKHAIPVYYMTMGVEVASNLERFDGVRYRGDNAYNARETMYYDFRSSLFGKEVQRRILLGTYASAAGYYDAYYNQASKVKEMTRRSFDEVFKHVDVLLTPTSPEFAFKIGSKSSDPLTMYLSDIFTAVVNPVRLPGLVVPLGLFDVLVNASATITSTVPANTSLEHVIDHKSLDSEINLSGTDFEDNDRLEVQDMSREETVKLPTGCQILGPELSEDTLYLLASEIEMIVSEQ